VTMRFSSGSYSGATGARAGGGGCTRSSAARRRACSAASLADSSPTRALIVSSVLYSVSGRLRTFCWLAHPASSVAAVASGIASLRSVGDRVVSWAVIGRSALSRIGSALARARRQPAQQRAGAFGDDHVVVTGIHGPAGRGDAQRTAVGHGLVDAVEAGMAAARVVAVGDRRDDREGRIGHHVGAAFGIGRRALAGDERAGGAGRGLC